MLLLRLSVPLLSPWQYCHFWLKNGSHETAKLPGHLGLSEEYMGKVGRSIGSLIPTVDG